MVGTMRARAARDQVKDDGVSYNCFFAFPLQAGVAKLADARDSKSRSLNGEYRFNSDLRHQPTLIARFARSFGWQARCLSFASLAASVGKPGAYRSRRSRNKSDSP